MESKKQKYTLKDVREYNVLVYSTGKPKEWYVRLWLGERKSHGIPVSKMFDTKQQAEERADVIAKYIYPLFKNQQP